MRTTRQHRGVLCRVALVGVALAALVACSSNSSKSSTTGTDTSQLKAPDTSAPADTGTTAPLEDGASGFAMSHGLKIHYEIHGTGKPLILVHGWGANINLNWQITGWMEQLQSVRQVIAIDIRGHGDSDKPHDPAAYTYEAMSTDIIAVMDHLGIKKADYVGYSLGAFTGDYLMGHEPDRFTSFVLMGIGDEDAASLALAPRIAAALRAPNANDITDAEAKTYRTLIDTDPRNDREALAIAALTMWPEGYPLKVGGAGLAKVHVPVLVINGANDPYAATDAKFVDAVPGAKVIHIPDADHFSVLFDAGFKNATMEFLRAHS